MNKLSFPVKCLIVALILIGLQFAIHKMGVAEIPLALYLTTLLFAGLTILIHKNLSKANKENPKRFVTGFMGAIGIKLFASLIFITIYLLFGEPQYKIPMAIGLMIVYSVYNVVLLRQLTGEIKELENSSV